MPLAEGKRMLGFADAILTMRSKMWNFNTRDAFKVLTYL